MVVAFNADYTKDGITVFGERFALFLHAWSPFFPQLCVLWIRLLPTRP